MDEGIAHGRVMSVAVSALERTGDYGVVYAGTEPSAIFRSEDGGNTWHECVTLRQLPSAATWSFPPRPYTSHIRWITPDPVQPGRIFAAAEAGALVHSLDGGQTWEDRKPDGPFDTHTLVIPRLQPNSLYSAAGDGFMQTGTGFVQSDDGGDTWYRPLSTTIYGAWQQTHLIPLRRWSQRLTVHNMHTTHSTPSQQSIAGRGTVPGSKYAQDCQSHVDYWQPYW